MPDKPGRHFLQIPGPTPLTERISRAIARSTIDHRGPEFAQLTLGILERLQSVFGTTGPIAIYPSSATGAWEAALVNALSPGDRVLEIGTGSGYQAAVLAEITDEVYSIEIIPELAEEASLRLDRLGYEGVRRKQADGYFGWEEYAPFDAIIVTAAPDHVPPPLLWQLKDGGNLVIPIGPPGAVQTLWLIERRGAQFNRINKGLVRFVPFVRDG